MVDPRHKTGRHMGSVNEFEFSDKKPKKKLEIWINITAIIKWLKKWRKKNA